MNHLGRVHASLNCFPQSCWGVFVGSGLLDPTCLPNTAQLPLDDRPGVREYVTVTTKHVAAGEFLTQTVRLRLPAMTEMSITKTLIPSFRNFLPPVAAFLYGPLPEHCYGQICPWLSKNIAPKMYGQICPWLKFTFVATW